MKLLRRSPLAMKSASTPHTLQQDGSSEDDDFETSDYSSDDPPQPVTAQWIDEDELDEMAEHSEPEPATKSKSGNVVSAIVFILSWVRNLMFLKARH
jgi:hypothetical protein